MGSKPVPFYTTAGGGSPQVVPSDTTENGNQNVPMAMNVQSYPGTYAQPNPAGDMQNVPVAIIVQPQGQPIQGGIVGGQPYMNAPQVQGMVVQQNVILERPESYFLLSLFSCVLCCWPIGILALCSSREVSTSLARGDIQSARLASARARYYSMASIAVGTLFLVLSRSF